MLAAACLADGSRLETNAVAHAQVLAWDDVVQRIVELQRTSRLCIVKDQLTAHDIANRILRKVNFMVAMINRDLLPLRPHPWMPFSLLSKTLEWNIYVCIFNPMFDRQFCIRRSFTQDVRGLQIRFICYGVVTLLLSPFIAAFQLFFLLFKHAEEWYRRPASSALSRDFSLHARWMMQAGRAKCFIRLAVVSHRCTDRCDLCES